MVKITPCEATTLVRAMGLTNCSGVDVPVCHGCGKSNLRIYVPQTDIRQRFPEFSLNRPYSVRATVTLDVGYGGQSGYWSPTFIEAVFPARERSQSITGHATF